jgi:hypothetical protein
MPVLTACIVPIPAEPAEDPDGGTVKNAYPVISNVTPPMPGPLTITPNSNQAVTITVSDSDLDDVLTVRIFIDYPSGRGQYEQTARNDPSSGKEDRSALVFPTDGWCSGAGSNPTHIVDVVVADRLFNDDRNIMPANQTPFPPGKVSRRSWLMQCAAP